MKLPKPIFKKTTHYYLDQDGKRWMTTAKPGSRLMPGCVWKKEHYHQFECFKDEEGVYVSLSGLDNPTKKDIDRVIKWLKQVKQAV